MAFQSISSLHLYSNVTKQVRKLYDNKSKEEAHVLRLT